MMQDFWGDQKSDILKIIDSGMLTYQRVDFRSSSVMTSIPMNIGTFITFLML